METIFDSLYDARKYAQHYANATGLQSAIYKPFNADCYSIVSGERDVNEAIAGENFVESFVPE